MFGDDVNSIIGPFVFLAISFVALGAGAWHLRRILWLRREGIRVPGVVSGRRHRWRVNVGGSGVGARRTTGAAFEFRTRDGRTVHTRQKIQISSNMMRPGQQVTVAYDPENPESAEILEAKSQILGAGLFIVLGALFSLIGLVMVIRMLTG